MKQFQNRPGTRAPHGSPHYPERVGAWVTEEQHKHVMKNGGSGFLRAIIQKSISDAQQEK
jgi:hypothetical protein